MPGVTSTETVSLMNLRTTYCAQQRCLSKSKTKEAPEPTSQVASALPLPGAVTAMLGEHRLTVQALPAGKAADERVGNNLDAAQRAVARVLGWGEIPPDKLLSIQEEVRALRGGVVNIGEAMAVLDQVSRVLVSLPAYTVGVACTAPQQVVLIQAAARLMPEVTQHSHNFAVATDAWQPVELQQQLARDVSVGVMHGDPELRCFGFVRRKGN